MRRFFPRYPTEPIEGILIKDGQVVIYLNRVGAEWLHSCLPEKDGFTRELWRTIEQLPHGSEQS